MNQVLIDTSVLIDFLRQKRKQETIFAALVMSEKYQPLIAMVTVAELYGGQSVWKSVRTRKELESMLSGIEAMPLTPSIAKRAGNLRATQGIPILDALIGATAIEHDIPVLTLDIADFKKIKGLKLFSLSSV